MKEADRNYLKRDIIAPDDLIPLSQFRDWIEQPGNLDRWMQYPQMLGGDETISMHHQANEVFSYPSEASPRVIFNLAMKIAEISSYFDPDPLDLAQGVLGAYSQGLSALSRSNKFSMQEHGHYWNTLTTLMNSQSIYTQQLNRIDRRNTSPQARPVRRTRPPGR